MRKLALFLLIFLQTTSGFCGVDFDLADDVLSCGTNDDILTENGALTISVWVFAKSAGEGNQGNVVGKNNSGVNGPKLMMAATNAVRFLVNDTTDSLDRVTATGFLAYNEWHHILVTWDGSGTASNVHIYIDDFEPSYATTDNAAGLDDNAAQTIRIGNNSGSSQTFDGFIEEVALWNVELSRQEITLLSKSRTKRLPLQIRPNNLKRYWSLDDVGDNNLANGRTFKDISPVMQSCTGDDGANNTGLVGKAGILSYP